MIWTHRAQLHTYTMAVNCRSFTIHINDNLMICHFFGLWTLDSGHTTLFNVFLMSLSWVMSKVQDDTLCAIFAQMTTRRRSCWTQPWPSFESLWTLLLMTDQCTLPSVWTRFDSDKSLTRETRGSEATCVDVGSNSTWKSKLSSCVHQMKIQTHLSFVKLNFEQIQSTTLIRRSAVAVAHSLFA